ncbi:MAG TPA: hypothetical protein VFH56_12745 [Acidimicrobiales bacterium]|nr:hypothetical protein [Acidimicrobiales bacterium]
MSESGPGSGREAARRAGTVVEFDEAVGLGLVDMPGSGGRFRFHCTQIADGSRSIPVGTEVTFVVIPGRGGQWEAGDVRRTVALADAAET